MLADSEIAYVAAVVDTFARIKIRPTEAGTLIPTITISNPHRSMLAFMGQMTATKSFEVEKSYSKHRCGEHCPSRHEKIVSNSGRWSISGAKATVMLSAIQPYVRFQDEEVAEALEAGLAATKKAHTVASMQKIGWPLPPSWTD